VSDRTAAPRTPGVSRERPWIHACIWPAAPDSLAARIARNVRNDHPVVPAAARGSSGGVGMRDRFYSTADLARVCGVSISTIKRWTDAGWLRCVRTPGGHRKYRVQDVADAARRLGLSCADAEGEPGAHVDELALLLLQGNRDALAARLAGALRAGETPAVRQALLDLHRHGLQLVDAALLLRAALRRVSAETAESADLGGFVERRAASAALAAVHALRALMPPLPPGAPLALVATAPGVSDLLATELALLALAEGGWRALDLGEVDDTAIVSGGLRAERAPLFVLLHSGGAAALADRLRTETDRHAAQLVLHEAAEDAAVTALRAHAAARARHHAAAMV
jgi:DNA-binding transcriptional MerR regulator